MAKAGSIKLKNNLNFKEMEKYAKSKVKEKASTVAETIFIESQKDCAVDTGETKESGYIKETSKGYEVGYSSDNASRLDAMPQTWLNNTGHGGKTHFLTSAIQRQIDNGGGIK